MRLILSLLFTAFLLTDFSALSGAEHFPPVSFQYNGEKIGPLTASDWKIESEEAGAKFTESVLHYVTPDGKLGVCATVKDYANYPVWEYSLRLTNLSDAESTGIAADFHSFEAAAVPSASVPQAVTLRMIQGDGYRTNGFALRTWTLQSDESVSFETPCGRSTEEYFPYIELVQNDVRQMAAVGWTGDWKGEISRNGKGETSLWTGMAKTSFKLLPSESIIQPSMTLFEPQAVSEREFKTMIHRFILDCKAPRDGDGNLIPPIRAVTAAGGNKTPEMMKQILDFSVKNEFPLTTYWIDAGWYGAPHDEDPLPNCGTVWYRYVGDWRVNTAIHPSGRLDIADAVHAAGMKFLLWFEPERVFEETPIMKEHPEYVKDGLLNYGNPEAFAWIQEQVYGMIESQGVDIYRQDFNMDPGPVWRSWDAMDPERVGIAEAKHIEGVYKFLDEMRVRFPGIAQENCAGGGNRLDIEMVSRAYSYCRSDYFIWKREGDSAYILGQNAMLNTVPFVPFQGGETSGALIGDDYAMLSVLGSGTVWTPTDFDGGIIRRDFSAEETAWFKKMFTIEARMAEAFMGDFYQLTDEASEWDDCWAGWQAQEPSGAAGFALVFRRAAAPNETLTVTLGGIDADANYELEFYDGSKKTVSGKELANYEIKLVPRSFFLAFYKKLSAE